jgi:signal transduction histidine kinase/PAS domain-containing protein/ActR/RegA family two-component response regulator
VTPSIAFRHFSIRHKLARIIMMASSLALVLAGSGFIIYDYISFQKRMVHRLTTIARMIAYNSESALVFEDQEAAAAILAALRAEPNVTGAAIYSQDGRLFASYGREGDATFTAPPVAPSAVGDHQVGGDRMSVVNTIQFEGNPIGSIYLESDLRESTERLRRYSAIVVFLCLVSFIIAMVVSRRMQHAILGPIFNLAETARIVSNRKDYSIRAAPHSHDEVGVLIGTFNEMLDQIQKRDVEVNEARDQLELRVEERTEDLQNELAERRRAEEALKKSQTLLSEAQRIAHIGSWEWEITQGRGWWSEELYRVLGVEPESVRATFEDYLDRVHPADREMVKNAVEDSLNSGMPFHVDHRVLLPDGAERVIHTEGGVTLDAEGRAVRMFGLGQDITEQRAIEEQRAHFIRAEAARWEAEAAQERATFLARITATLASSLDIEKTLPAALELAVSAMADWCTLDLLSSDGTITRVAVAHRDENRAREAAGLRGRSLDRNGRSLAALVLASGQTETWSEAEILELDDPEQVVLLQALGAGYALAAPLYVQGRPHGAFSWVRSRRPFDPAEKFLAEQVAQRTAIAIEHAQLYREAQRANQLKDEFLATLSHELRTPLQAIVGWARLLQTGTLDPDSVKKAIDTISRNAQAQNQLISDVLDVSRIIAGKLRLNLRSVHLVEEIEAALDTARPAAEAKQIKLDAVLDPSAGPISGDPDRLQQVVWNLLSNAIKFVPRGGRVLVRLEPVNSHVEVVIEDNGPGIPEQFLPYIFERFRQADSSTTRRHGGLGIGLAIVRHIVELHGGTVAARNRDVGTGAIFTLTFPRRSVVAVDSGAPLDEHPAADRTIPLDGGPSLEGLRVLVVDDEQDAREMVAAALELNGAQVFLAAAAPEAFDLLVRERPDVLLSDIEMPGRDGYELIQEIRKLPRDRGGATPAVALTAYATMDHRVRSLRAGFQLHVVKPVQPAELATVVASLAGRVQDSSEN